MLRIICKLYSGVHHVSLYQQCQFKADYVTKTEG